MIYCRLWRWSDLHNFIQLKAIDSCQYGFLPSKQDNVCINPYHYVRVETPVLPPVLVPAPRIILPTLPPLTDDRQKENIILPPRDLSQLFLETPVTPHPAYPHLDDGESNKRADMPPGPGPGHSNLQSISGGAPPPIDYRAITYQEPPHWCSVNYYERNNRVSVESFHALKPSLTIDGYTYPGSSADRFCVGLLSNIHRDEVIERTRQHIGRGVRLSYVGGKVWAECLSKCSIFLQSRNMNMRHSFHPTTVCKIPPGYQLCIFNNLDFANMFAESVKQSFESVYELTKMCTIRISFVKGWGAEYARQDVTSTPCWIEVHLNGPLMWLDKVLSQMRPTTEISSMS